MAQSPLKLGCPVWACPQWRGTLYRSQASRREWLSQYSKVFQTVEVNSTFYALPSVETVRRWCQETEPGFEFCLKFPRVISHQQGLRDTRNWTMAFYKLLETLREHHRIGPAFLQLPPEFSGRAFPELRDYLASLTNDFSYAVEVRHPDWYDRGPFESSLDQLLAEYGVDRCLFDSRALYSRPAMSEHEKVSQTRKPNPPFRKTTTGVRPMVRLVGRDRLEEVEPWWNDWARIIADWLEAGLHPVVFTHAPDDTFAPILGEKLWNLVRDYYPALPMMTLWPGRSEPSSRQQTLF